MLVLITVHSWRVGFCRDLQDALQYLLYSVALIKLFFVL